MKGRLRAHTASPHRLSASISACLAALISVATLPSTALAQSGDMNCDGAVNTSDVSLFVEALLATGSFDGCDINRADMNADGLIDGRDTQQFVVALMAPPCAPGLTFCDPACVDLTSDSYNCGACYHQCAPNEVCAGAVCQGQ